jgi:OHCU decarboxylase
MSVSLAELDGMPADEAASLLASCCGVQAWVEGVLERRPFGDVSTLLRVADDVWWSLGPDDWRETFAHHPRIGARTAQASSAGEQRRVASATADVRDALAEGNRDYEQRFGHIYLVSAAGRTAEELLAILQSRLSNDPTAELRAAAAEQAKITRLRLLKLLGASKA